jgi:hypothetical protein
VNLSSQKSLHNTLTHAPGLLSAVAGALIEKDESRTQEEEQALTLEFVSIVSSRRSSPPGSPARGQSPASPTRSKRSSPALSPAAHRSGALDDAHARSNLASPKSASSSESSGDPDTLSSLSATGADAYKEGELQFKAISIICNLSLNDEEVS